MSLRTREYACAATVNRDATAEQTAVEPSGSEQAAAKPRAVAERARHPYERHFHKKQKDAIAQGVSGPCGKHAKDQERDGECNQDARRAERQDIEESTIDVAAHQVAIVHQPQDEDQDDR